MLNYRLVTAQEARELETAFIRLREYLLNMRGRASELCATGATVRKKVADSYRRIADAGAPRRNA